MQTSFCPHGGGLEAHGPRASGTTQAPTETPTIGGRQMPVPHCPHAAPRSVQTGKGIVVVVVPGTTVVLVAVVVVVVESATGGLLAATQRPSAPQVPTTASPLVLHVANIARSSVALVATASLQVAPACWQQTRVAESGMSATQPDGH